MRATSPPDGRHRIRPGLPSLDGPHRSRPNMVLSSLRIVPIPIPIPPHGGRSSASRSPSEPSLNASSASRRPFQQKSPTGHRQMPFGPSTRPDRRRIRAHLKEASDPARARGIVQPDVICVKPVKDERNPGDTKSRSQGARSPYGSGTVDCKCVTNGGLPLRMDAFNLPNDCYNRSETKVFFRRSSVGSRAVFLPPTTFDRHFLLNLETPCVPFKPFSS